MNFKKSWMRENGGFTLVELIVVIAILAILAGIAVPAYSGYIKKANKAADMQVLAAVNTAFAAACLENGSDVSEVADAKLDTAANGDGLKINGLSYVKSTGSKATNEDYNKSFNTYMSGTTAVTKVVNDLRFVPGVGFVDPSSDSSGAFKAVSYAGKTLYVSQAQVNTLTKSALGGLGANALLTEVGDAVDMANELGLADMGGENFNKAYLGYLGVDLSKYDLEDPEQAEKAQAELDAAVEKLGGDEDQILANSVALYAAQNSTNLTVDSVGAWLGDGKTADDLQGNASASTLSEAAAIYGLYMSYANTNKITLSDDPFSNLSAAMANDSFAEWVNDPNSTAHTELDAYKAAMSIINDTAADDDARAELLANGFADEKLIGVMQGLMGK